MTVIIASQARKGCYCHKRWISAKTFLGHGRYLLIEQEMRVQESPQIILKGLLWEVQLLSKTRDGNLGDRKVFKTRASGGAGQESLF